MGRHLTGRRIGRLTGRPRGAAARARTRWAGLLAGAALVAAGCTQPPAPPDDALVPAPSTQALPGPTAEALQSLLDGWVADGNGEGVTAAVVAADGTWAGAAGVDGAGRGLTPEAVGAIGGVTRTFVAAEVLLLADAGRLDLGDPVSDHVDLPFDARGASVRQALALRAGFPVFPDEPLLDGIRGDLDRSWTGADVVALADPRGPRGGQQGGTQFPNDLNYVVLGMVVEAVTGDSLGQVLRRDLLEPAALERTWVQDDEQPGTPRATGDDVGVTDPDGPYLPSRAAASALGATGGMAADASDTARWGYLLYGGHVLDADLVGRMTARDPGAVYGLGTELFEVEGEPLVGHTGDIPGHHTVLLVWPARATAVAVLVPSTLGRHVGTGVDAEDLAVALHRTVASARG